MPRLISANNPNADDAFWNIWYKQKTLPEKKQPGVRLGRGPRVDPGLERLQICLGMSQWSAGGGGWEVGGMNISS